MINDQLAKWHHEDSNKRHHAEFGKDAKKKCQLLKQLHTFYVKIKQMLSGLSVL